MRRKQFFITTGLIAFAATGLSAGRAAAAQQDAYVVRYLCFAATPKVAVANGPQEVPPVFRQLQAEKREELGSNPEAFVKRLAADEPNYTFRTCLAGSAVILSGKPNHIHAGPNKNDPYHAELTDEMSFEAAVGGLDLRQKGEVRFRAEALGTGSRAIGWDGRRMGLVPGRTLFQGGLTLSTGERIVYVFSVAKSGQ